MTSTNLYKKHWTMLKEGKIKYLCIQACDITASKVAIEKDEVTCQHCIRLMKLMKL